MQGRAQKPCKQIIKKIIVILLTVYLCKTHPLDHERGYYFKTAYNTSVINC